MKAVIFGPGRIGCGFAGQLLRASGYELIFVARNPEVVQHLNRVRKYRVVLSSTTERQEVTVDRVQAVWTEDRDRVAEAIAEADLVATAVGPQNLAAIAPLLAAGLACRSKAVNVLAFENLINAGQQLRRFIRKNLPACRMQHGFAGALVNRVVTHRSGDLAGDEPFTFYGEPNEEFHVHRGSLKAPMPPVRGMRLTNNYTACVQRKLYIFSAGHATTAYLGALKGYQYIHAAIRDPEIRGAVLDAMAEGQRGLAARFGKGFAGDDRELEKVIARFENATLNDPIERVGRDPRRKIGAKERLVGAARMAETAGVAPKKLALATAAAFCFCNPADPSCDELRNCIQHSGFDCALNDLCGINPEESLARNVSNWWERLAPGWQRGNLLLSLDRCMWAWC